MNLTSLSTPADPKALCVTVHGDLTSTNAEIVRTEAFRVLDPAAGRLTAGQSFTLNLSGARMVDSVGLNLIVSILKAVQQAGGSMTLVYSNPNVHRTLLFTRLDRHLKLTRV